METGAWDGVEVQFTWGGPPVQTLLLGKEGDREKQTDFSEISHKAKKEHEQERMSPAFH